MSTTAGYAHRCKADPDRARPPRPTRLANVPLAWVDTIKTATVGWLLASQGCAAANAPSSMRPSPPWRPTVGCEFEIYSNDATHLSRVVERAGVRAHPPMQLSYGDAARLWLGHGVNIPHKGQDVGAWRVVPELAFPLDTHEVISSALRYDAIEEVRAVAHALTHDGQRITGDGAFHVHVGHAGVNTSAIADLTHLWGRHHALLFGLSNTNLRQQQLYARPPERALLQRLNAAPIATLAQVHAHYVNTHQPLTHLTLTHEAQRFYALNLHYLTSGTTVEFRAYQFVDRPSADLAIAYVDLSVALMAAARDGTAARLAQRSLDPIHDATVLLDALHIPEPSYAVLLRNTQRLRGFAYFDGELRNAAFESFLGSAALAVLRVPSDTPNRPWQAIRWVAEGVVLTSALHVGALSLEAWGRTTYVATYAAREWSVFHFLRIGLGVRAAGAFY